MFEAVEHEQQLALDQCVEQLQLRVARTGEGQIQRLADVGYCLLDGPGDDHLHDRAAVAISLLSISRDLQREPRLSNTAGTDDRHESVLRQKRTDLRELPCPTDQRYRRRGECSLFRCGYVRNERRLVWLCQRAGKIARGGKPITRLSLDRAEQHLFQRGWDIGSDRGEGLGLLREAHGESTLAGKRRCSCQHLVKHASETVHIASRVDLAVAKQL